MAADITIRKAETLREHAQAVQIRTLVFVVEQNVPAAREIDEHEDKATYFVAYKGDEPVGTVRWRRSTAQTAKIERLAVTQSGRGLGVAQLLTVAAISDIQQSSGINEIKLGAQDYIITFYEKFGFVIDGDGYLDGGTIPHHDMKLTLK